MSEFDIVEELISNDKKKVATKKRAKRAAPPKNKYQYPEEPYRELTLKDLEESGWNVGFDETKKNKYKEGDVINGYVVRALPALSRRACVYDKETSIYGWGKDVDDAAKHCALNIKAWKARQ